MIEHLHLSLQNLIQDALVSSCYINDWVVIAHSNSATDFCLIRIVTLT